jgi:hypothetical protein
MTIIIIIIMMIVIIVILFITIIIIDQHISNKVIRTCLCPASLCNLAWSNIGFFVALIGSSVACASLLGPGNCHSDNK